MVNDYAGDQVMAAESQIDDWVFIAYYPLVIPENGVCECRLEVVVEYVFSPARKIDLYAIIGDCDPCW